MSRAAIQTIEPKTPGLLTRQELASYLQVDYDAVPDIARRFGLTTVEDHFPERAVWRQVLGLEPIDEAAADLLRQQLQDIGWVSRRVGKATSTIRDKIRAGTFQYSPGVQLGAVVADRPAPRTRRFVPALIEAQRCDDPVPDFRIIAALPVPPADAEQRPSIQLEGSHAPLATAAVEAVPGDPNNVFGLIAGG